MKKLFLAAAVLCCVYRANAQLTVTTNPSSATICAGNSVSLTASATPVSYTTTAIANNPYDPTLFAGNLLVDQLGVYNGGTPYIEPVSFGNLDDGRWDNISLPFTFRFYGNTFNSVNISTNGWVGLGSTNSTATGLGVALPNAAAPNNVIHGITCDLTFAGATNAAVLQYFTAGSAPNRQFVIDYSNLKFLSGGTTTANVQIILYETTNVIEIHTTSCTNTTINKAQGIENSTGTVASVATGRNNTANWTGIPNAYRFTPDAISFTWSPGTGLNTSSGATVIASPTSTTTYTVSALNPSNGQTGNTTVTVTVDPSSYTLAGSPGGPQICQNISVSGSGTNYRDGNCNLIANITPAGASPVTNSINTCVQVDNGSTKRGTSTLYLARKYDMEPIVNPATSTANITLYYLQSEFNNYNSKATDSGFKPLPTGPADAAGIANLVLRQFHGTGTNPTNYSGTSQDFTTATSGFTVTWNATRNWWEVVVPVNGFSGFYLTSAPLSVLAVSMEYFKGISQNGKHLLNWKANCTSASVRFEIQRSGDGQQFTSIGTISASQARCSQPFDFSDERPLNGTNYYRIRMTEVDGKASYSNIVLLVLKDKGADLLSLSPNPVTNNNAVLKLQAYEKLQATLRIADFTGRILRTQTIQLIPGINQLPIDSYPLTKGVYYVSLYVSGVPPQTIRLIKQ